MNERLYRSVDDRVIAGVCGGLAVRLAIDPSLVRIAYVVVAFVTGIVPLLVLYVVMAAVVPEEPTGFAGAGRAPVPPGPDAVPGWTPPDSGDAVPGWTPPGAGAAGAGAPGEPAADAPPDAGVAGAGPPGEPQAGAPRARVPITGPVAAGEPRRQRRNDPVLAVVGGLILVCLGIYFLVRDQVSIDWGIVWAAGLMALGVVVVVSAFVRPRR